MPAHHLALRTLAIALLSLGLALTASAGGGSNSGGATGGGAASGGGNSGSGGSSPSTQLPNEILVKLRTSAALDGLLQRYPVTLVDRFGQRPIYRLRVIGNVNSAQTVLNALTTVEPDVLIAEPNYTHSSPEARRNMPWVVGSAAAYAEQWAPQALHVPQAQQLATGAGVRVAVLDTGFDLNHPLLAGHWLPGFDFVDFDTDPSEVASPADGGYGHGTQVAGLIATVAPAAQLMPLRVLDSNGVGNAWVLGEALLYALDPDGNPATDDGAHIINLSLGTPVRMRLIAALSHIASCGDPIAGDPIADRSDPGYNDDLLRCSLRKGAVVIAAAGNDASASIKQYPAAEGAYGLLAIGASTSTNRLAIFTNTGSWIGLAGPGEGITSSMPGGGYATWSGTSMAAPLVSGTAALVQSTNLGMTAKQVLRRLTDNSAALCGTNTRRVDALGAVTGKVPASPVCR